MATAKKPAVGIDLGTTYSCIGCYRNGKVEIIANDQGNRITPSYVSFNGEERFIGEAAKENSVFKPEATLFDAKRLMGKKFSDEIVQNDMKLWPFKVVDKDDRPMIEVTVNGEEKQLTAEEISAMVLTKMKETAETYLGGDIVDAVITVPAYFNDIQRQATKDAGIIAGFNVLSILNEPTAAAIAYGLNEKATEARNVVVFDLGGGTFDVVVMTIDNGMFDVKAVGGDTHLGGQDFDNCLMQHFAREFKRKHGKDMSSNTRAMTRLRKACEKAKRTLSSAARANVDIDSLFEGIDFHGFLTRARFEELCEDQFELTMGPLQEALEDSGFNCDDIHDVVLVGGSTRIIKIKEMLQEFFKGKKLTQSINPDEAVAYGAAIQAAILTGQYEDTKLELLDVTPNSLGIETAGGIMNVLIKRNTKVPIKIVKKDFTTFRDNQENICIRVYAGENGLTKHNELLGSYTLDNIQKAPRGVPSIDITFEKGLDDILKVSAVDRATKSASAFDVKVDSSRLKQTDIGRMIEDEKTLTSADKQRKLAHKKRNELETYCMYSKAALENASSTLSLYEREHLTKLCEDTLDWLDEQENASLEVLNSRMEKLKAACDPLLAEIRNRLPLAG